MKVLNIILEPRLGGPQLRIADVGKVLKEKFGVDTVVLFPGNKDGSAGKYMELLDRHQLEYKTLKLCKGSKNISRLLKWLLLFLPEVFRLKRAIIEINPDIIHCNGSWQLKGVVAAKMAKKKVIWHLNDTDIPAVIRLVFRILSKKADGFIFAGGKVKEYYLKYIKSPGFSAVIHAPVDTGVFNPENVKPDPAFNHGEHINVVTTANITCVKGLEYFIEAAHLVSKRCKHADFYIVGGKLASKQKYTQKLEAMVREYRLENVHFHGFSHSVPALLKASDIYVCSSIYEATPRSVWEAMAMKKPIVSTDVGSVSDFVKNGNNGFIVPATDSRKIAEKIEFLVNHPELWEPFGEKSREIAKNHLDTEIIARQHDQLYRQIVNGELI